jgi:phosphoribosylanthranilate isomerase
VRDRPGLQTLDMTHVKICGITSIEDALMCVAAGADAIGLNFVPVSPRCIDLPLAAAIVRALPAHVMSVGVFVDADYAQLMQARQQVGLGCLQLHGDESPELLSRCLPHAYKALRVRDASIISEAARYAGEHLLLDAYVPGAHGGTGARFDWSLAAQLAQIRKLTLAGGLTPGNVAQAVAMVRPFCVDVASGVERSVAKKDALLVQAFVRAAKGNHASAA